MKPKLCLLLACLALVACSSQLSSQEGKSRDLSSVTSSHQRKQTEEDHRMVIAKVGDREFQISLEDNQASREFLDLLPMTIEMAHVNGNEVYYDLGKPFTTSHRPAGQIQVGDLKIWEEAGLVLFYKDFSSSYSYTDLGQVMDAEGLEEALQASTTITFTEVN